MQLVCPPGREPSAAGLPAFRPGASHARPL